ncbi:hypothetical protein IG631_16963 [Alternaria alternata]|nr:hypothetical protein IG631_16963 [Alternaria alternata]
MKITVVQTASLQVWEDISFIPIRSLTTYKATTIVFIRHNTSVASIHVNRFKGIVQAYYPAVGVGL